MLAWHGKYTGKSSWKQCQKALDGPVLWAGQSRSFMFPFILVLNLCCITACAWHRISLQSPAHYFVLTHGALRDANICCKYVVWLNKYKAVQSANYGVMHDATMNLLGCTMLWETDSMSCKLCMHNTLMTVSCMLAALSAHASQPSQSRLSHNVQDAPWLLPFRTAHTIFCSPIAAVHPH